MGSASRSFAAGRSDPHPAHGPCPTLSPPASGGFTRADTEQAVDARFEQQVARYPDRTALAGDAALTYAELNEAANRVAHAILAEGDAGETPVALLVRERALAVVAMLGVLKAGRPYVPLDPAHPRERLARIVEHSGAHLILAMRETVPLARALAAPGTRCLNIEELPARSSCDNPVVSISPDDLAYVLYTSGSTGQPKGVAQTHRNVLHNVMKYTNGAKIGPGDRVSVLSSYSFGASVSDIYGALLNGATLLPHDLQERGPAGLAEWLDRNEVTIYHSVPTVFRRFVERLEGRAPLSHLRLIKLGGEPVSRGDFDLYRRLFDDRCVLYVGLGATEMSIIRRFLLNKETEFEGSVVPVGYAVEDTEILLLDEAGQEVGVDRPGEITIRSRYLPPGYWRDPELTRAAFLPDPAGGAERLHRTGDVGRMLPDGCLVHLGRRDGQVKIRGQRVEVAEVELALRDHPGIREAAVAAREDRKGEKRLVGYFVARSEQVPTVSELRRTLAEKLPEPMVPSALVQLDAMPLTTTGKVDYRALPQPGSVRPELANAYVAPRTPIELRLAEIWQELLGLDRVGVHDSFFELGGNSLLAALVIARLGDAAAAAVSLRGLLDAPTVASLARRIESASPEHRVNPRSVLEPVARTGALPLSFAQQRLWFLDRVEPASAVYNIPSALRLTGALDAPALERSLREITRRHEALRTAFTVVDGEPVQVIDPEVRLRLPVVDLRHHPAAEREAEATRRAREEAMQPFDLAQEPLFRAVLLRLDEQEHVLLLTLHHSAADGWSRRILFGELSALYEAFRSGQPASLPELPIQYADYTIWQRSFLLGDAAQSQLDYWKRQLSGIPALLELPTDRPRPAIQTFEGAKVPVHLPPGLIERLKAIGQREGATLFMPLLAALQTLLYRYSGQEDVCVGTPIAGRTRVETEGLIGFFVNTLVLRTDLSGDPSFRQVVTRAREVALGAYSHQDLPFEKLVEELHPERSTSHTPLFQVMLALQNRRAGPLELPGLIVTPLEVDNGTAKFDLTLSLRESLHGVDGSLEYNTGLFDEATARRLVGHFQVLLEAAAADPEQPVSRLPLLSEPERRQLLLEWSRTPGTEDRAQGTAPSVHHLFEAQAERTPNAPAVVYQGRHLTYAELNRRANQLAHYLHEIALQADGPGANGPDGRTVVGICMERSLEMIVALLGVLKAGAAYVPLDPSYPTERLAFMIADSGARVLLDGQQLAARLPELAARSVCLERERKAIASRSGANPTRERKGAPPADSPAYVIYTSGSTGRPKGLAMGHQPLSRLIRWQIKRSSRGPGTRTLQFASLSFDVSFQEIFSTLCSGGTLVLIDEETRRDPVALWRSLSDNAVDRVFLPPVALQQLAEAAGRRPSPIPQLREVITAGEALRITPPIARLFERLDGCTLHNQYGPSETHVVTAHTLTGPPDDWPTLPPIGRPLPHARIYVLDAHLQPVPAGVPGELFIGGGCLAAGYPNQPELTAEKFIPDPFIGQPGARLYRTGDLTRYLPDGTLQFLGRRDHQVKIRGYRIELGEIEAVLGQHPAVQESVVLARVDRPGDRRIAAYLVLSQKPGPTPGELRDYLASRLPEYMVPAHFVLLESIPLTPNGKVDRRALPSPQAAPSAPTATFVGPADLLEAQLLRLWEEVLGVEGIGVNSSFFDLGGHSLSAVRLFCRIEELHGKHLPLVTLFQAPTVEQLAEILRRERSEAPVSPLVPIRPAGSKRPLFCVHGAGGHVLCYRNLPRYLDSDQPIYGLYGLQRREDAEAPAVTRVEEMAAHHIRAMRALQPEGPYLLCGFSFGGMVAFEMAQQLHAQQQRVALLAMLDTGAPGYRRGRSTLGRVRHHVEQYLRLSAPEKRSYALERASALKLRIAARLGRPAEQASEEPDQHLPPAIRQAARINLQALESYQPRPYPGPITLFMAVGDASMRPGNRRYRFERWRRWAKGGLEVHEVPGNHTSMVEEPHVGILVTQLSACLQRAQADSEDRGVRRGWRAADGGASIRAIGQETTRETTG